MKNFDKKVLLNNISHFVSENNLKIGEIEKLCNVSTGYISRLKESNSKPSIEFVYNLSEVLNIPIDNLINVDYSSLLPTEEYIFNFVDKLIKDTKSYKLGWEKETVETLENYGCDINGYVEHPLLECKELTIGNDCDQMTDLVYTMNSNTFGYYTSFYKDCFYLEMKQQRSRLYVMYLSDYHYNSDMEPQLEIWLCTKYSGNKFLCSTYQNDNFKNTIYALYNSICEYSKHPKIEEEYKNIIDSYMNDEECEDTNDLIESDDLPFY